MFRCVICQVEYEEGEQLAALLCQHPFHGECINQWLQIKKVSLPLPYSLSYFKDVYLCKIQVE